MSTEKKSCDIFAFAKRQLQVEASTIASSEAGQQLIRSAESRRQRQQPRRPLSSRPPAAADGKGPAQRQRAHLQQCFYRICSPVTAFKVVDPDPSALDGGHVLALRFEAMSRGQFLKPYYLMLNRAYLHVGSARLRVHRHTFPPAIPLAGLAARHLPGPGPRNSSSRRSSGANDDDDDNNNKNNSHDDHDHRDGHRARPQDLDALVRALRREIARYHNRMGVTADLRRDLLGLRRERPGRPNEVVDVGIADVEARHVRLTFADGRSGRLLMDNDGNVVKLAVYDAQDRDWDAATHLAAGWTADHADTVTKQLHDYAAQEEEDQEED
ncbi:central kinetochore subunit Mal2/MCM21 [Geosmithia morbida]|uniref:Central kinetochore subunit Mal2/MCM21 n=1 Tax=Geosmithia morbida TaxID=1094350 RepID=A0A9P4YXB4_9HYPO|nr:central kinetochore subunit Mal2/MCM21 [Geosmithia morbida]KAF4124560.1 central kinetochore subunit Mal2/MCM21 [Geosmithia morbida]